MILKSLTILFFSLGRILFNEKILDLYRYLKERNCAYITKIFHIK